jgi:hypothetical protein
MVASLGPMTYQGTEALHEGVRTNFGLVRMLDNRASVVAAPPHFYYKGVSIHHPPRARNARRKLKHSFGFQGLPEGFVLRRPG